MFYRSLLHSPIPPRLFTHPLTHFLPTPTPAYSLPTYPPPPTHSLPTYPPANLLPSSHSLTCCLPLFRQDYELEVAKGLGWDGTTVTPVEFIYELLSQLLSQQSIPNDLLPQLYTNSAQISTQLVLGVCVCVQVYVYISAHFYKCVCLGLN